ncbi:MAG: hypothetical protein MUE44_16275 [Oscillatoriaceae cyanobacterium Prado104]|jgi:hypothetical protein|nr:hypothetical protein [Oscillatoriaceae cyanobacterium Prado104]
MTSDRANNNNIEFDRLHIEIALPEPTVLAIPENKPNANAPVYMRVGIADNSLAMNTFNFYENWLPEIIAPDGEVLQPHLTVDDRVSIAAPDVTVWRLRLEQFLSIFVRLIQLILPSVPVTDEWFFKYWKRYHSLSLSQTKFNTGILEAQLFWHNNLLRLNFPITFSWNRFNQFWSFDLRTQGIYQLRLIFLNNSENEHEPESELMESQVMQPENRANQLATPLVNLHLVEPLKSNRNAVELDGIQFETIVPDRVAIVRYDKSDVEKYNYVELGMKITNGTPNPLYFNGFTTLIPEMLEPDGQIIEWGRASNWIRGPSAEDFLLAQPGESVTFFPITVLFWLKGYGSCFSIAYGDGSIWGSEMLKPGKYQFRFSYQKILHPRGEIIYRRGKSEQLSLEGIWYGRVDSPFVELNIVDSAQ